MSERNARSESVAKPVGFTPPFHLFLGHVNL